MKSTSGDSVEMSVLMSIPDGLSLPVFWTFCVASLRIVGLQWAQSLCLYVVLDSLSFAWLPSLFCKGDVALGGWEMAWGVLSGSISLSCESPGRCVLCGAH